ncbi:excisionase family DNA-binding protein [Inquilinus sp.]|uniref:helix-turn-helix domain-containing protein n=1 Tax=Inquilinus sp. TaxID=1932117 RepID=UPI0031D36108
MDQTEGPFVADDAEAVIAKEAARKLGPIAKENQNIKIAITGVEGGNVIVPLPARAVVLISELLSAMAKRVPFSVIPHDAEFTTQETADFLNVSRPYVVGLIDKGTLPARLVGRHRRVKFSDILTYEEGSKKRREAALKALAEEEEELGLD